MNEIVSIIFKERTYVTMIKYNAIIPYMHILKYIIIQNFKNQLEPDDFFSCLNPRRLKKILAINPLNRIVIN